MTFGPFTLDTDRRELLRGPDQASVHLSPKAFELLCVLVETRPRALAKSELHERLWPSTFVSEATLASLVFELREGLHERGRHAHFIRTVHGFGYRFAGEAQDVGARSPVPSVNWLIVEGREQMLGDGEYVIGRGPDVAISFRSPTVSRRHAKIVVAGASATLEDLGSKNGTYLRGLAVESVATLMDRDRIRIGAFDLTYRNLSGVGSTETEQR